jgi:hypothetical protein
MWVTVLFRANNVTNDKVTQLFIHLWQLKIATTATFQLDMLSHLQTAFMKYIKRNHVKLYALHILIDTMSSQYLQFFSYASCS